MAAARKPAQHKAAPKKKGLEISLTTLAQSRRKVAEKKVLPFSIPKPPPGVIPNDSASMAMDAQPNVVAFGAWAGGYYGAAFSEGLEFLGYPYLAELSQRPEYRRMVEVIATEMTRKWIKLTATGDDDKTDKIKAIDAELVRLEAQKVFKILAEQDGFFGRSHLYLDTGKTDDPQELLTPIGNGRDKTSQSKIGKGDLKALRTVEAVWTYPTNYNSNDPLKGDWYKPDVWFVMGKRIHATRLLTFIGREVPDLLKPAYSFGGLALTQMAKPYVDNWLQTRQGVNDIVQAFSTFVLSTNMAETLQAGGEMLLRRAEVFNNLRNNRGLMLLDKEQEEFQNVAAPLGSLDALQAQSQEHMAAVSGIPLVKLLGITPSGLNASSDGEIRCFYDWIAAYQLSFFHANLCKVIDFVQLSLFGEVDDDIGFQFEPLWALDERSLAEVRKIEAETADILVNGCQAISPEEVRQMVAADPGTPYAGLDPDDLPEFDDEEDEGESGKINLRGTQTFKGSEKDGPGGSHRRADETREAA